MQSILLFLIQFLNRASTGASSLNDSKKQKTEHGVSDKIVQEIEYVIKRVSRLPDLSNASVKEEVENYDALSEVEEHCKIFDYLNGKILMMESEETGYEEYSKRLKGKLQEYLTSKEQFPIADRLLKYKKEVINDKSLLIKELKEKLREKVNIEKVALNLEIELLEAVITHRERDERVCVLKAIQSCFKLEKNNTEITLTQQELLDGFDDF